MPSRRTRRTFLRSAGLGGLGVLFLREGRLVAGTRVNEKLNIGIIGAGGQGAGNTGAVGGETIAALCDVDEHQARDTFRRFPNAKRYTDFREMLDKMQGQLDAVVVSTPDHTHAVAAVAAMKLGLHTYCEKPLTRTVYESRVMREVAEKQKVVTQMGNQGSASEGLRRGVELAWAGVIGDVLEAHVWFGGGNGPRDRPKDQPPVPPEIQWDLWLGPAPSRPYHPAYVRGGWRSWRAFGTGSAGDFGCHSINMAFRALRLDLLWKAGTSGEAPSQRIIRVEAEASEVHPETYPRWFKAKYEFPKRGDLPPAKFTWSNGGPKPLQDVLLGHPMTENGCLVIGTKGAVFSDCPWNTRSKLLPEKKFEGFQGPPKTLPRSPGHHAEWLAACKGGPVKPFSSFDIGGPMTEIILLGNAALLAGQPIEYDPIEGNIVNCAEPNKLLHRDYRPGWVL